MDEIDQQKIGRFLQELRKGSGFTQEQAAEKLNVSGRTISRRETGRNMPDLDLILQMAELYDVDLRELLEGERKSEKMDKELEETVVKVASYSNEEKQRFLTRLHWLFVAGLIGFVAFLTVSVLGLERTPPYEAIASCGLGFAFGMIIVGIIFTSRYAGRIRAFKKRLLERNMDR